MNGDQSLDAFMAVESIALEARQLSGVTCECPASVMLAAERIARQVEFLRSAIACAEVDE